RRHRNRASCLLHAAGGRRARAFGNGRKGSERKRPYGRTPGMHPMLTVGQMLNTQSRLQPERIGARDLERAMTFRQWNERACRLANGLLGLGLARGARVAVLAYNRVEWAEIYAAVAKAGLVAVPINFRLTATEALYICQDSGVSALIAEDALIGIAGEMREALSLEERRHIHIAPAGGGRTPAGWTGYEDLIAAAAADEPQDPAGIDDPWCLMYTSGTTGKPKGAIRGHRGMAMLALMTQIELSLKRGD